MNILLPLGIIYYVIIYYKMALGHIYANTCHDQDQPCPDRDQHGHDRDPGINMVTIGTSVEVKCNSYNGYIFYCHDHDYSYPD